MEYLVKFLVACIGSGIHYVHAVTSYYSSTVLQKRVNIYTIVIILIHFLGYMWSRYILVHLSGHPGERHATGKIYGHSRLVWREDARVYSYFWHTRSDPLACDRRHSAYIRLHRFSSSPLSPACICWQAVLGYPLAREKELRCYPSLAIHRHLWALGDFEILRESLSGVIIPIKRYWLLELSGFTTLGALIIEVA